jgi:hypothetical protein
MRKDDANHVQNSEADLFGLNGNGREDLKRRYFEGRVSVRTVARFYKVTVKDAEDIIALWKRDRDIEFHKAFRRGD